MPHSILKRMCFLFEDKTDQSAARFAASRLSSHTHTTVTSPPLSFSPFPPFSFGFRFFPLLLLFI